MKQTPSTAIDRALNILEALAEREDGLTNSQVHRLLHIPKSSASYILRELEQRSYVVRDPESGRYRLGLQIVSLSRGALKGYAIRDLALPLLQELSERTHLTVHLAVLDHGKAVYVEKVDAPGFIKMNTWVGRRMDLHCTAVGKSLAAWLDPHVLEAILHEQGLPKRGPKSITTPARFLAELKHVREQGYAVDDEENNAGARCVAAPIVNALSEVQAAVGVSGTATQVSDENLPRIVHDVRDIAHTISQRLAQGTAVRRSA